MPGWQVTKGLNEVGGTVWAHLRLDDPWRWSDAGLVIDGITPTKPMPRRPAADRTNPGG